MSRGYSTPCAREIGAALRKQRERAGLTSAFLARALGWAASKLSRVEAGAYPVSEGEVSLYLGWCKVPPAEMQYVRELQKIEERNEGLWLRPNSMRSLGYHESTASRSTSYSTEAVPGLLQTQAYMTELFRMNDLSDSELQACVEARLDRQAILHRDYPADFRFFVHEQAIRLPVGDPGLMRDQLLHLVFSAARSNIDIRVVPNAAGGHAVSCGAFVLLEYSKEHRPLVFLDSWAGGLFIEDMAYIAQYKELPAKLDALSLTKAESQLWLADLASDHDRGRGAPDADVEEEQLHRGQ